VRGVSATIYRQFRWLLPPSPDKPYPLRRAGVIACIGLTIGLVFGRLTFFGESDLASANIVEAQMNSSGAAVAKIPTHVESGVVYEKPVRSISVSNPITDPVVIRTIEWQYAHIMLPVTTTAYPYYDGGDNRTCDNRLVQQSDYTFAVSRDMEKLPLTNGTILNVREKILDPRGSGRMVYRWRAFIPGYSKVDADGNPIWDTLAVPRDRTPKTVWINAQKAKKFKAYKEWKKRNLFLDARVRNGVREVRIATRNWVDVMYTHPGTYGSIEKRCLVEWGKIHPDHATKIYLFELKEKVVRVDVKNGVVNELK
jgi:hypothetical protein